MRLSKMEDYNADFRCMLRIPAKTGEDENVFRKRLEMPMLPEDYSVAGEEIQGADGRAG